MKNWKQSVFFGMVAIIALGFGFVGCDDGNNDNGKTYNVTIGTLTNGSIDANPKSGVEGTEITLTVDPENLYRLKAGTLKYGSTAIDESTLKFKLPAENVTVTAEFESLFIGSWDMEGRTKTFSENIVFVQLSDGKYFIKGTWYTEAPNKLIYTWTHCNYDGVATIDELPIWSIGPVIEEFTFEFLDNSSVQLFLDGVEYVTLVFNN
jgi:hypothetical protein